MPLSCARSYVETNQCFLLILISSLHVLGYNPGKSDFFFDKMLDARLWGVIQQYSERKPTLVFASSRKATVSAATKLLESCSENGYSYVSNDEQRDRLALAATKKVVNDPQLSACILSGIGFHHAGMAPENRLLVESLFATGKDLMVVVATSTLAVGVNLPAYLVIIKSTSYWTQSTGVCECNPIQIRQMIGRAGRPQFGDSSAAAVIMTQQTKVATYESILECDTAVTESNLHKHLTDTLLNEICLGSISTLKDALTYLQHTFLAVRMRANPQYYATDEEKGASASTQVQTQNALAPLPNATAAPTASATSNRSPIHPFLRHICMKSLASLKEYDLITMLPQNQSLAITEIGQCMSRYFISVDSIKALFSAFPPNPGDETYGDVSTRRLLEAISNSPQFSETLVRRAEKKELREVSALTRFPVKSKGIFKGEKVSILLQSLMLRKASATGNKTLPWTDISLKAEVETCATSAVSLLHCAIQFFIDRSWFYATHKAILLLKSIKKRCWINGDFQTTQIPIVSPEIAKRFETFSLRTLLDLKRLPTDQWTRVLNGQPALMQNVKLRLQQVPHYTLSAQLIPSPSAPRTPRSAPLPTTTISQVPKLLKIVIQQCDQDRIGSRDKFDRWMLLLGQAGNLVYSRPLSLSNQLEEAATLQITLPDHLVNGTLELVLASDEWIGLDIVGTVTLDSADVQCLAPQNESQDPYNEDSVQKNVKKRKKPTSDMLATPAPSSRISSDSAPLPCHHKCKNKFTCKHKCCKLHPDVHASGRTHLELPASHVSSLSSASNLPRNTLEASVPTAKRYDAQLKPRSEPVTTVRNATSITPSTQRLSTAHDAPFLHHSEQVRAHLPQPVSKSNHLSTSVYNPSHVPPISPRSVSPLPRMLNTNELDNSTTISAASSPSVVITRPGRTASFLPPSAEHASSYAPNPATTRINNPNFVRPTLRPGPRPANEIFASRTSQAKSTASVIGEVNRIAHDSARLDQSKRSQRSILAPPSPFEMFNSNAPSQLEPIRSSALARASAASISPEKPPSVWRSFLDWELAIGLQPEP